MGVKVSNNAFGTLAAGINTTDTTITVDSGQGARFPTLGSGEYFFATLVDTSNNLEIVKVTARSTDSMTVVRAQDNTTAAAFSIGDRIELRPVAALFEAIYSESVADASPGAGTVTAAMLATTQDLSGKTLTLPSEYGIDGDLYNFSGAITFTNCSATGRIGPSYSACTSAYASETNQADWRTNKARFYVLQGIQYWVVPKDGAYEIETAGAGRDVTYDGRGAIIKSTHTLKAGEILRIQVGQKGGQNSSTTGNRGGHGASACAVIRRLGDYHILIPLSIGGGGAGFSQNSVQSAQSLRDATYTNSGVPEGGFGSVWQLAYPTNSGLVNYWPGGGGGGWLRDGSAGGIGDSITKKHNGGASLISGGIGGFNENAAHGGFGGGGGTGRAGGAGAGGGGYSGGHAMSHSGGSGNDIENGGGSYTHTDDGASQTNVGLRTGQGYVKITL
jgi:hypothetical protein